MSLKSVRSRSMAWALCISMALLSSCAKQEAYVPDHNDVAFSVQQVSFDTVLANRVSATKVIAIRNHSKGPVRIENLALHLGAASPFSATLDGLPLAEQRAMQLEKGDSALIFLRLRALEGIADSVHPLRDTLYLPTKTGALKLPIVAHHVGWLPMEALAPGQQLALPEKSVRYITAPFEIPQGAKLTLAPGSMLIFARNCGLLVKGTLEAQGTAARPVLILGDRMEAYYRSRPGQWLGITLAKGSHDHILSHVDLRGAVTAFQIDTLQPGDTLRFLNCRIQYSSLTALAAYSSPLDLKGCILAQNYRHALYLRNATANLTHCTLVCQTKLPDTRLGALVSLEANDRHGAKLQLHNSILWGDRANEIDLPDSWAVPDCFQAHNSLLKLPDHWRARSDYCHDCSFKAPNLENHGAERYMPAKDSPARLLGDPSYAHKCPTDFWGVNRTDLATTPDAGAAAYALLPSKKKQ